MSLFYFNVRNINKSSQSAVASASYRSGEKLYSERDMEFKSYRGREVKPDSFILAPKHAPKWANNREELWNEVEKVERNWNSRLSRELLVALPVELTNEQQKEMLKEYVNGVLVNDGMVADISIHRDREHNPHAHIMLTVRPFNEDGSWGNKRIKNENGKWIHSVNWNDKETLLKWRESYAEKVNEWYKKLDIPEQISHESYEKQGLNKIPRLRLTREEYQFEERQKEISKKQGKEYQPSSHYAKINKEIEVANKKMELIEQKVVSLSDYRQKFENEKLNEFNQIRRTMDLSEYDWEVLKKVAGRVGGFLDYKSAKENLKKLDNWKKKIDYKKLKIDAEEKVLSKARLSFDKNPKSVLAYGFIPNKFEDVFLERSNELRGKKDELNQTISYFEKLYDESLIAYDLQKQFTNEEFKFLYPEYAQDMNGSNEHIYDVKFSYTQQFRENNIIHESLHDFDKNNPYLSDDYHKLNDLLNDWESVNKDLLILERTKAKIQKDYKYTFDNFDAEKVFDSSVKFTAINDQISEKESKKEVLKDQLFNMMKTYYPNIDDETIKEIPEKVQSQLLSLHLTGESTGILSEDLLLLKQKKYNDKSYEQNQHRPSDRKGFEPRGKYEFEEQTNNNVASDSGQLFNTLIQMAQSQETKDNDLERKRKMKKKARKNYLGGHEL
ncbi:MobA/MobL family protein [Bacillus sp. 1663tsa1]|nr:MobQ family relaxase [Bacillus sp. 1663tsa1]MCP1181213.1 MobA/MobL family protein [Bacillus sp. 1663tsa1]